MASHTLEGARPCAKPSLYDRIAADNRNHPLQRTRDWQYFADEAAKYARELQNAGKTPIQIAGERLDDAVDCFRRVSSDDRPEYLEEHFGSSQAEYLDAKAAYMALLSELTGETAAELERRAAA